jgi:hypothetical protein
MQLGAFSISLAVKDLAVSRAPMVEADEASTGPASFIVVDPDGNPVLFDQHR